MRTLALRLPTLTITVLFAVCAFTAPPATARAPAPALTSVQRHYLALAQTGVAAAELHWRDRRLGWYDARLGDHDRYPLATIWDIVPLFQSLDAIAIAQPTRSNRRAVIQFATGAERYLNRGLHPVPGYSPYPGDHTADTQTWFDDNGWWGLAFLQAYRATGARRYLTDAQRALRYIAVAGWNAGSGGIWWNTHRHYTAGEALASATLLATLLYQQTRSRFARTQAQRFLDWANTTGFSQTDQLYAAGSLTPTPIDYIQSPLIYAQALLCRIDAAPVRLHARQLSDGERASPIRPPARVRTPVRRHLPAMDARAVLARRRSRAICAGCRERARRPDRRGERRRPISAPLERTAAAHALCPTGDVADPRRHDQPVRLAGRGATARLSYQRPYQRRRPPTPASTPPTMNPSSHSATATSSTSHRT
jgi:hypothetical protein